VDAILLERHTEVKTIRDQTDAQIDQVRQKGGIRSVPLLRRSRSQSLKSF